MFLGCVRQVRTYKFSLICFAVSLTFLLGLLTACGSNASGQGSSSQATPTATQPVKAQNCGSIHVTHLQVVPADQNLAAQSESCFFQAFQQCHPATLTFTQNNLDSGAIHNFSLKSVNGSCTVSDSVQNYVAPRPPQLTGTYTCGNVALQKDGLHISSCGQAGNIVIPVTA